MSAILDANMKKIMEKNGTKCLDKTARIVLTDARRLCPVSTGKLRDSLQIISRGFKREIGSDMEYAWYVEMGTAHVGPRPFLRPALAKQRKSK